MQENKYADSLLTFTVYILVKSYIFRFYIIFNILMKLNTDISFWQLFQQGA